MGRIEMLSTTDVAELENMVPAMEAAWRAGDAASYAAQFTADAEHVNAYGMWWHGRDEICNGIGFALSRIYRTNPIATSEVAIEPLSEDIAVVRHRWRLQPYSDPDGTRYADHKAGSSTSWSNKWMDGEYGSSRARSSIRLFPTHAE